MAHRRDDVVGGAEGSPPYDADPLIHRTRLPGLPGLPVPQADLRFFAPRLVM